LSDIDEQVEFEFIADFATFWGGLVKKVIPVKRDKYQLKLSFWAKIFPQIINKISIKKYFFILI
jgi:hypothetical protein